MHARFLVISGVIIASILLLSKCKSADAVVETFPPEVVHPADNLSSPEKIALGRKLFFDTRLSKNNEISCATCHKPEFAFTDRLFKAQGVEGRTTERNATSLLNVGFSPTVMFDAHLETLEKQVIVPIQEHTEMDMDMKTLIAKMSAIPEYAKAAKEIFNRDFDPWVLTRSIAAFERSLTSFDSPFDRFYYKNDASAITESQVRGWKVFSKKLYCTECHAPPFFTNFEAMNNGIYHDYGKDQGRFRVHGDSNDLAKFKVPSLRNITLTYPYMHDGSFNHLEDVIMNYSAGGQNHKNQDPRIKPFKLNEKEQLDLLHFFDALVDTSYMERFR